MNLVDHPLTRNWLEQFSPSDRTAAELLIKSLKLVSFEEAESNIRQQIESLASNQEGKIALIPISKIQVQNKDLSFLSNLKRLIAYHFFSVKEEKKAAKSGSEGRVGHLLENLQRLNSRRFVVNPTIKQMKTQKIKHIVLVDDLIGSGTRLLNFWKQYNIDTQGAVKSWI